VPGRNAPRPPCGEAVNQPTGTARLRRAHEAREDARAPTTLRSDTLRLLMSRRATETWGGRITSALAGQPHAFVLFEDATATTDGVQFDVAFLTRDVTGNSTKHALSPELKAFDEVLRRSQGLRWLHIHPAGADRPIYAEMRARSVTVTTSSGATAVTVAQTAAGAVIALARRFPALMDAQRRHAWEQLLGARSPRDLGGQTAVIVGMGPIGAGIARLLVALGMTVIGVRRSAEPVPPCERVVPYGALRDVLPRADWLILACPLSPITRGLIDGPALALLPQGAHLVNVARGEVTVERDVIAALSDGRLAGAYLDVFQHEPLDSASPLWDLPNVIVSPHTASHSQGLSDFVFEIFLDNLARWREGRPLRNDLASRDGG
jgi:D-2-hydroxyacid dehydrogenase (NADP+)